MNKLSQSTSPYLLQHANNPVHWQPWGEQALEQAKSENKLILVSIGYSACHWCHVMEHESFENEEVAKIMNKYFVSIKIDREERPDLDHIYMGAVQLMTQRGGWPLNVICMPDTRPVWGGTYFPRENWMSALNQLAEIYEKNPEKVREYADQLHEGLVQSEIIHIPFDKRLEDVPLLELMAKLAEKNDLENGGEMRAPKFPMPGLYSTYLKYAVQKNDEIWLQHIHKTLEAMAQRGINDLVHGGFFRYATDQYWHIPHFEKMLYDNAQLMSLYSKAYGHFKNPLFKKTVEQIFDFLENEMQDSHGAYYAALDADSEGVEGKYYTLSSEELATIAPKDCMRDTFNLYDSFIWEHVFHLHQTQNDAALAKKWSLSIEDFHAEKETFLQKLKSLRSTKTKPGLDDKVIIAWNALAVSGLIDAHCYLHEDKFLHRAEHIAQILLVELQRDQPGHYFKEGKSVGKVQLEDYAHTADALLKLFQITNKDIYYQGFTNILQRVQKNFGQSKSVYFPLAQNHENELFYAGIDLDDNVIPATNSVIAKLLYAQGLLTANHASKEQALLMLQGVLEKIEYYLPAYYLWADFYMDATLNHKELVISCLEKNNSKYLSMFYSEYRPHVSLYLLNKESGISLFASRFGANEMLYLCEGSECKLPVKEFDALEL